MSSTPTDASVPPSKDELRARHRAPSAEELREKLPGEPGYIFPAGDKNRWGVLRPIWTPFHVLGASLAAASVESLAAHPLDTLKTHVQTKTMAPVGAIRGSYRLAKAHGLSSWYRGALPATVGVYSQVLLRGMTNDIVKMSFFGSEVSPSDYGRLAVAGAVAGVVEAQLLTPFDGVKVVLQLRLKAHNSDLLLTSMRDGWYSKLRSRGILGGLYRGHTATMARQGVYGATAFGSFSYLSSSWNPEGFPLLGFQKLAVGVCAGVLTACVGAPLDTVRTRMMAVEPATRSLSMVEVAGSIWAEDGLRGFYRGAWLNAVRVMAGTTACLIGYETIVRAMRTESYPVGER